MAQRYPFYNLGVEQGLIQSQATALVQDGAGHLWIGTMGGLSRFDGHSFTNFSVRDGLPSNTISALAVGPSDALWIGTSKGLALYDGYRFKTFSFQAPENPRGNMVSAIATTGDTTWCVAGSELYIIRNGVVQSAKQPAMQTRVTAVYASKGTLYLGLYATDTFYSLRNRQWKAHAMTPAGRPISVRDFYADKNGRLWILTTAGLGTHANAIFSWKQSPLAGKEAFMGLNAMTQALDGSLWMGSISGAVRMTDSSYRRYGKANGLTDNRVASVLTDKEGNLWLGTDGQGIFRFSGAPFVALDENLSLPSAQIMGFAPDDKGGLYLGTYDAGLYHYSTEGISRVPFPDNVQPTIVTLAGKANGPLWIGTRGEGLWRYKNGRFRKFGQREYKVPATAVTALYQDADERLWIGFAEGAAVYEQDSFRELPLRDGVVDFLALRDGSMLMATGNGLRLYKNEQVIPYITNTAADQATAQCLALQGGYLWIGTNDNGVIAIDTTTGKATVIIKASGLRSDFIYNLFAAADSSIWAGTGFGIYNIRMERGRPTITFYGRGQGATGIESNHNAVLGLPDGNIWFGTTNGAMHYRPGIEKTAPNPVSIVLQSLRLFGDEIKNSTWFTGKSAQYGIPQNLELPYRENNLTLTFQAISLGDISGLRYRYRMTGLEKEWSDWATTNTVTYSALPPGNFSFEVQCSVQGNDRQIKSLAYPFRIRTPFHRTGIFRLLVLGGCILLGVSLQYLANRRRSARHRLIEELRREEQAKVRERTAEDFHDEVGNRLTRINVLTNVLQGKLGPMAPDTERIIRQIQDNAGELYSGTRDILWSLKPSNDFLPEIINRIRDFGQDLFGDTAISFEFSGADMSGLNYRLPIDMSRNLIMIFKEAMNNSLKYAAPTHVSFSVLLEDEGMIKLSFRDDGIGFSPDSVKKGNGLLNMQTRARRLNAILTVASSPGIGTTVCLDLKIPHNRG